MKIFLLIPFFINCIAFTEFGWDYKLIQFPKNTKLEKKLLLKVNYKTDYMKYSSNSRVNALADEQFLKRRIEKIIFKLDLFEEVNYSEKDSDYSLTINYFNKGFYNMWLSSFSLMSLALIPNFEINDLDIEYVFRNNQTGIEKNYKRKLKDASLTHLFLLPIAPFQLIRNGGYGHFHQEALISVFDEAIRDGVFEK
jgi:hypothetical protein